MSSAKRVLGAASAGLLFGAGLVVSGMTNPHKVLAFLDPLGAWDPSLAFVMIGAIGVYALAHRFSRKLAKPLAAHEFHVPSARSVDARLVFGAATFGVGWGLAGYCPGPSVVAIGSGSAGAATFVIALLGGIALVRVVERVTRHAAPDLLPARVHYSGPPDAGPEMREGAPVP
jgi:uncharacterized protein